MSATVGWLLNEGIKRLRAAAIDDAEISARLILQRHLDKTPAALQLAFFEPINDINISDYYISIQKRADNYPLQYIIGAVDFYNISLHIDPRVLIPRPETEVLVEKAIAVASNTPAPRILDIGTGSGNIAIALAASIDGARITAIDISEDALSLAGENAVLNSVENKISFLCADCLKPSVWNSIGVFDLIVSNPPYIGESEYEILQPEIKLHEPKIALVASGDMLKFYRMISRILTNALRGSGAVLFEIGAGQAEMVAEILNEYNPNIRIEVIDDLAGIPRVVIGKLLL